MPNKTYMNPWTVDTSVVVNVDGNTLLRIHMTERNTGEMKMFDVSLETLSEMCELAGNGEYLLETDK